MSLDELDEDLRPLLGVHPNVPVTLRYQKVKGGAVVFTANTLSPPGAADSVEKYFGDPGYFPVRKKE